MTIWRHLHKWSDILMEHGLHRQGCDCGAVVSAAGQVLAWGDDRTAICGMGTHACRRPFGHHGMHTVLGQG